MIKETIAGIDIGSNAIRLLINYVEKERETTTFKKALFIRVPLRLGEDVFTYKKISTEKTTKLCKAMRAFSELMEVYDTHKFKACATSAMREAVNNKEIIKLIKQISGIDVEIISGAEEAKYVFAATSLESNPIIDKSKSCLYVDVGGGSTELIIYNEQQKKIISESFPIGTVRMLSNSVQGSEWQYFKHRLKSIATTYNPACIIGSGGNINKIFKILGKKEQELITCTEIKSLYDKIVEVSYEDRIKNMKLNEYRADVIVPALKIFLTVCKQCNIEQIMVPNVGLADGIIRQLARG
ncbi:MAG: hypothetical protein FWD09_03685 [Lentimicrobiaceae bacterium]|nr:hypothetical protein [Lentimicrobiaceae bacterium]